jgi:hypothetical protein
MGKIGQSLASASGVYFKDAVDYVFSHFYFPPTVPVAEDFELAFRVNGIDTYISIEKLWGGSGYSIYWGPSYGDKNIPTVIKSKAKAKMFVMKQIQQKVDSKDIIPFVGYIRYRCEGATEEYRDERKQWSIGLRGKTSIPEMKLFDLRHL